MTPADTAQSAEALRQDIAEHRAELAATVDALARKLDVKTRTKERLAALPPAARPALAAALAVVVVLLLTRRRRR